MIAPAGLNFAFGNARLRALKSRLRTAADLRAFRAAPTVAALANAVGLEPQRDPRRLDSLLFASLLVDYRKLSSAYRSGAPLFDAFLRLHEVENLKLGWRARMRALAVERWTHLWRPLGPLEVLRLSDWRDAATLRDAAGHARSTRYEAIVREVLETHEQDLAAAEMAFDRWAWESVVAEARRLPRREREARELANLRVRERDFDFLARAVASYRLPAKVAPASTVLLRQEEKVERLGELAEWTREDGLLGARLPRRLARRFGTVRDWDALTYALRRDRRDRCLRAFHGYPFRLAPPVAYLLLREEEVRSLRSLAQSKLSGQTGAPVDRVLAASAMDSGPAFSEG